MNPLAEVIEKLKKADEANDFIRADNLFLTVGEAIASLSSAMKGQSTTTEEAHTIVPHYWLINEECGIYMHRLKRNRSSRNRLA